MDAAHGIWCLKEAYVIAIGRGISFGLQRIDCSAAKLRLFASDDTKPEEILKPAYVSRYRLTENHRAALVCLDVAPESFVAIDLRSHCQQMGVTAR